ncbi:MAG: hypothetical protein KGI43_11255 [Alphaproteobacteria bacterium]|nr:hypothetical protein [Alphaproteobacteria bacterium]
MDAECETLLRDLQRYQFLLRNFVQDKRLARVLLHLIAETDSSLRECGVENIPH